MWIFDDLDFFGIVFLSWHKGRIWTAHPYSLFSSFLPWLWVRYLAGASVFGPLRRQSVMRTAEPSAFLMPWLSSWKSPARSQPPGLAVEDTWTWVQWFLTLLPSALLIFAVILEESWDCWRAVESILGPWASGVKNGLSQSVPQLGTESWPRGASWTLCVCWDLEA